MKKFALYAPIVVSLLVLGAHFLRYDSISGFVVSLLLIVLLLVWRAWAARLVQVALVLGAMEWARTIYVLVGGRIGDGEPYARMMIILGVVMVITFCSALLFQSKTLKRIYRLDRPG